MGQQRRLFNGGAGSSLLMLSGLPVMGQAAFLDGQFFELSLSLDDGVVSLRRQARIARDASSTGWPGTAGRRFGLGVRLRGKVPFGEGNFMTEKFHP